MGLGFGLGAGIQQICPLGHVFPLFAGARPLADVQRPVPLHAGQDPEVGLQVYTGGGGGLLHVP